MVVCDVGFLDGDVLHDVVGGCLRALVGTRPSAGGSDWPGACASLTRVHSPGVVLVLVLVLVLVFVALELPFSSTSTCCPLVTVSSRVPGAAE